MGSRRLVVDDDTFKKVMVKCKEEFLRHHPEFKKMKISQNKLIDEIAEYYLSDL